MTLIGERNVITSYSIHYTKLYDPARQLNFGMFNIADEAEVGIAVAINLGSREETIFMFSGHGRTMFQRPFWHFEENMGPGGVV